ncbi:MAG: serine protease [Planctomycetota bacterium]
MRTFLGLLGILALCGTGCTQKTETEEAKKLAPSPWVAKPVAEWPQIVLTNDAEFEGSTGLKGASAFAVQHGDRLYAATAYHLLGPAGGVEPQVARSQIDARLKSWKMFPRTQPESFVKPHRVALGLGDDSTSDLLFLDVAKGSSLPSTPLRMREDPVQVGETVYLLGCPYSETACKQNVYKAKVTLREWDTNFRYDLETPVDLRGFSGAPIVDSGGHLVGIMAVWWDTKMKDGKDLEGGAEDIAIAAQMLHKQY